MKFVMYGCGILFILVGIGGAIGYAQFPAPTGYIVAPIWALSFIGCSFLFFGMGKKFSRMLKPSDIVDGVNGTATVVMSRQGGMRVTVNGMSSYSVTMTLDVALPGQQPYRVQGFETMCPMMQLMQLRPGAQIPIRVDRADAKRMALDFEGGAPMGEMRMQAMQMQQMQPQMQMQMGAGGNPYAPQPAYGAQANAAQLGAAFQQLSQQGALAQAISNVPHMSAAELLARGTPGRASILTATPTGQTLPDGRFVFAFTMQVWMQGNAQPIQAAVLHAVPAQAMARAVPGSSLPVAVDPSNPTRSVAIDWNRA